MRETGRVGGDWVSGTSSDWLWVEFEYFNKDLNGRDVVGVKENSFDDSNTTVKKFLYLLLNCRRKADLPLKMSYRNYFSNLFTSKMIPPTLMLHIVSCLVRFKKKGFSCRSSSIGLSIVIKISQVVR